MISFLVLVPHAAHFDEQVKALIHHPSSFLLREIHIVKLFSLENIQARDHVENKPVPTQVSGDSRALRQLCRRCFLELVLSSGFQLL